MKEDGGAAVLGEEVMLFEGAGELAVEGEMGS